jgi:multiple sugar transport system substrate-binding protein
VVYVNVDLFEEAGLQVPYNGWTWEEFIEAAMRLTIDIDGDGALDQYGVVVESSMYRMSPFIWSAGGELVDDTQLPTQLMIDTPEAKEGIERFVSLGVAGHNVVPPEAEVAAEDDLSRFARGGAGMYLQSRRPVPTLREIESFRWDVVPLPVISQPATVSHSDAFCLAANVGPIDAAWTFVEFAAGPDGQLLLAETGRTVPSLIDVSQSRQFLTGSSDGSVELPPSNSMVYLQNIDIVRALPNTATWPEVEAAFNAEFARAFYVEIDIDAAIDAVIERAAGPLERDSP